MTKVLEIATAAGMTHDAIQQERSGLSEYAVTSFAELHGEKWDSAIEPISDIHPVSAYSDIMAVAERFAEIHREAFCAALKLRVDREVP
ncbi:MAG: hypothetical protein ACKOGA_16835 [Planctomycetaceae bacterium]